MFALFDYIGAWVLRFLEESGKVMVLFGKTLALSFRPPFDFRALLRQIEEVGIRSIPVVLITGTFTEWSWPFRATRASSASMPKPSWARWWLSP